jgi:hypothetical protein
MVLNGAGNVGIGTSSPGVRLDVETSASSAIVARFKNTSASGYSGMHFLNDSGTATAHVGWGNGSVASPLTSAAYFGSIASAPVVFTSADTERVRITSGGLVGIATSSPTFQAQVNGTFNSGGGPFIIGGGSSSTSFYDMYPGAYFHSPAAMFRKDSSSTAATEMDATVVLYNKNGTDNTGTKLAFVANETTSSSANPVATAAIVSQKVSGTTGAWANGNLKFLVKSGSGYIDCMTINNSGNVSVGTTTSTYKFQVAKVSTSLPAMMISGAFYGGPRLQVYGLDADANAWMGLGTDMAGNAYEHSIYYSDTGSNGILVFCTYNGTTVTQRASLSRTGALSVTGNITAYSSDVRIKKNIKNIDNALQKLLSINGVTFNWDLEECNKWDFYPTTGIDVGVIAQEVQAVLPEVVEHAPFDKNGDKDPNPSKSGKNYLTVNYEKLVPLLIEAIKEQQKQIEELKALINNKH